MDGQSVIALIIILAVVGGLTVRALPFIVGLLGVVHGLFVAPVVQTVKDFKARYLLMPEDRPDYYVDEPLEEVVSRTGTPYRPAPDIDQQIPASMGAARTGTVPTDEALIRHLAGLQKPSGAWCLSANKVFDAVGGDRGSVLAIVREVRGLPDPTPPADPRFPESTKDGRPVASHLRA